MVSIIIGVGEKSLYYASPKILNSQATTRLKQAGSDLTKFKMKE